MAQQSIQNIKDQLLTDNLEDLTTWMKSFEGIAADAESVYRAQSFGIEGYKGMDDTQLENAVERAIMEKDARYYMEEEAEKYGIEGYEDMDDDQLKNAVQARILNTVAMFGSLFKYMSKVIV